MNDQKDNQQVVNHSAQPVNPYYVAPQENDMNFMDLWLIIVEQKKLIIFFTVIGTLVALTYALLATPIYRAEAILAPVSKDSSGQVNAITGQFSGLASLAGINLGGRSGDIEEAIATLKSRGFTNKLISDENIMPVLFENKWDKNNKQWVDTETPPTLWDAYNKFNKSIRKVSQDKKTGLITVSIEWKDPVLAAEWVSKLVARINRKLRQEAIMASEKSIKYLQAELQKTSVIEIKESIYSLIEAQTKTKMLANTQEEYAFRVIDSAVVPEEKIRPKRSLIVVSGFISGVILGIFIALLRRMINLNRE